MMYAYYEVVSSEEERKCRLKQIKDSVAGDICYYSAYIEVSPRYDAPLRELRAMRSLKAAIKRGRIQTLVISSLENLYMQETHALSVLFDFVEAGVQIALGEPTRVLTENDLFKLAYDAQMEYIMTTLSIPLITMQDCVVHFVGDSAFIHLEEDFPGENHYNHTERMLFIDAVRKFIDIGFFVYRADVQAWYHIPDYMAEAMKESYEIAYKTLYECIGLGEDELPVP